MAEAVDTRVDEEQVEEAQLPAPDELALLGDLFGLEMAATPLSGSVSARSKRNARLAAVCILRQPPPKDAF